MVKSVTFIKIRGSLGSQPAWDLTKKFARGAGIWQFPGNLPRVARGMVTLGTDWYITPTMPKPLQRKCIWHKVYTCTFPVYSCIYQY